MFNKDKIANLERQVQELQTENRSYTEIVTQALVDAAVSSDGNAYVSALETAAGQLSRCFSAAQVEGPNADSFNPWVMGQIGRSLVEAGEAIYWRRAGSNLVRVDNYGIQPSGTYQLNVDGLNPILVEPDRVLHVRWNMDINSKRGEGPLTTARTLRQVLSKLETSLSTELNAAIGYLLPLPTDGQSKQIEDLKEDIADLKGKIAVIETTRAAWDGSGNGPRRDFDLARLGPDVPASSVNLFNAIHNAVLTACGMPVNLAIDSDGTGQREAWRRYLHGTVAPLGRLLITAAASIGLSITLDWGNLFASDISGRARAFQSLVNGGMDTARAAIVSGLIEQE